MAPQARLDEIETVMIALQAAGVSAGDIEVGDSGIQLRGGDAIMLEPETFQSAA